MSFFARSSSSAFNTVYTGTLAGCAAHGIWGFAVLYWALLDAVPSTTILAHRMLWSLVLLCLLLAARGRLYELKEAFARRREIPRLMLCAALLTLNWGFFLWGVSVGKVVESTIGYFCCPLLNVLMGRFLLGEKLSRAQAAAILLAALAVSVKTVMYGQVPWLAFVLALSFGFYGFFQKGMKLGAAAGLAGELVFIAPFALAWLWWAHPSDFGAMLGHGWSQPLLLMGTALFTAIPLQLFGYAAQRIPLATLGILQYVSPSINFILACTVLGEKLTPSDLITFPVIWCSLVIYSRDALRSMKQLRRDAEERCATLGEC